MAKVSNKHSQIFTKNYIFRFVLSCEVHYQERRRLNNHNNQVKRLNIYKICYIFAVTFFSWKSASENMTKITQLRKIDLPTGENK